MIAGKVLQDRHSPDGVRDETEQSLLDTEALIRRWRTGATAWAMPSAALRAQLQRGAAARRRRAGRPLPEVDPVARGREPGRDPLGARAFPAARSSTIYRDFGLMRERAVYAHCIRFDDADRALMRDTGAAAAIEPPATCSWAAASSVTRSAARWASASACQRRRRAAPASPFHTMLAAYYVGREGQTKPGSASARSTCGGSTPRAPPRPRAGGVIGNLRAGCDADFLVLDPQAAPASRKVATRNLDELLFSLIVLGDDRVITQVHAQASAWAAQASVQRHSPAKRCGCISAAFSAMAPPWECPTK